MSIRARRLGKLLPCVLVWLAAACSQVTDAPPQAVSPPAVSLQLVTDIDTAWNRYIVILKRVPSAAAVASEIVSRNGGSPFYVYEHALKGFALANVSPTALARIRAHPQVVDVFEDYRGRLTSTRPAAGAEMWGLDKIDSKSLTRDNLHTYYYTGTGTHIYILDTGIRGGHSEFAGRMGNGKTCLWYNPGASPTIDGSDDGHGTAVASIAAGTTYGVATGAIIHSVRISNGGVWNVAPWWSDAVCGLDWVAGNAIHPAVANLSSVYGGSGSNASGVSSAMDGVVQAGVVMVKAVGEVTESPEGEEACNADPEMNNAQAIRVSASNNAGQRMVLANYGRCLDLFAPGQNLLTAINTSNTATGIRSGTSIAAPYVAGVAALIRQQRPSWAPSLVKAAVVGSASYFNPSNIQPESPTRHLYSTHSFAHVPGAEVLVSYDYPTNYTWNADVVGGNGTWSYQWAISVNGAPYINVGDNSASYTYTIQASESSPGNMLRLTATSGMGDIVTAYKFFYVFPMTPCGLPQC